MEGEGSSARGAWGCAGSRLSLVSWPRALLAETLFFSFVREASACRAGSKKKGFFDSPRLFLFDNRFVSLSLFLFLHLSLSLSLSFINTNRFWSRVKVNINVIDEEESFGRRVGASRRVAVAVRFALSFFFENNENDNNNNDNAKFSSSSSSSSPNRSNRNASFIIVTVVVVVVLRKVNLAR